MQFPLPVRQRFWMTARKKRPGRMALEFRFRDAVSARPFLAHLMNVPGVLLNNLRGRVTAEEAVYRVELSGLDSRVTRAIWSLQAVASTF